MGFKLDEFTPVLERKKWRKKLCYQILVDWQ